MLSIVIPYHNEGLPFIGETVRQIRETIDCPYEVIIVDDGSVTPLVMDGVKVLRHPINKGVGAAFDTGVAAAKFDNLFLMGSDIRFIKNQWASKMVAEINQHPKAFICTACIGLNREKPENMDIEKRRSVMNLNGATILLYHDQKSNPRMSPTFRGILEAKWLPGIKEDSFEIPCILGAAYGVKKQWYNYVDGWAGHYQWGTLEPYISLKSWLFGGSCRCARHIETGHIFKPHGTHGTKQESLIYNKMMVATMLFDDYPKLISFLGCNAVVERGRKLYNDKLTWILAKRLEYRSKIKLNINDYCTRWNIDMRA